MKIYRGYSDQGDASGPVSVVVDQEGREPYKLRHMIVHSPSGLSWGFQGSGPADLALSILADYLGEAAAIPAHDRYDHAIADSIQETAAWLLHQEFKRDFVARLPQDQNITIDGADIEAWLDPRHTGIERLLREKHLLLLLGKRVTLTDGAVVDVLDIVDDAPAETLLVYAVGHSALHRTVALSEVAQVLDPMPDDDEEEETP